MTDLDAPDIIGLLANLIERSGDEHGGCLTIIRTDEGWCTALGWPEMPQEQAMALGGPYPTLAEALANPGDFWGDE